MEDVMEKYEYIEFNYFRNGIDKLNELGKKGWKITPLTQKDGSFVVLMREITPSPAPEQIPAQGQARPKSPYEYDGPV
jgi:hypothetical protein